MRNPIRHILQVDSRQHTTPQLLPLFDAVLPIRGRRGRPRRKPRELFADRGYVAHGSGLGKQRWVVERAFAWLHAFKRLRTPYERRADLHLVLLQLACVLIC